MKKTKVVCTMGPNTNDRELLRKLIQNGMDVARFQFFTRRPRGAEAQNGYAQTAPRGRACQYSDSSGYERT